MAVDEPRAMRAPLRYAYAAIPNLLVSSAFICHPRPFHAQLDARRGVRLTNADFLIRLHFFKLACSRGKLFFHPF